MILRVFETNVVHIQTKNVMICGEPRQIKNDNITQRIYFTGMINVVYNFYCVSTGTMVTFL